MKPTEILLPKKSAIRNKELTVILFIAISWTLIDFLVFLTRLASESYTPKYEGTQAGSINAILLRELNVFVFSLFIGYFLVTVLRNFLRNTSPWLNLLVKTVVLVSVAVLMNFFIYITYSLLIEQRPAAEAFSRFIESTFEQKWIVQKMPQWVLLFILTLLALEINNNYSQGVFFNIIIGKYLQPREEKRIILFLDLKNSTPIAEKLGHKDYFKFIRDVIYCLSAGIAQHDGRVYQYVGDEIVAWWPCNKSNARKCINALIESRKILNKNADIFRRWYGVIPEYKAGMHAGNVTVGQVGITKKDLVMSGDTINTAARIRSACTELNQKYLVSKEMAELLGMENVITENIGVVDLKGKSQSLELYALRI